MIRDVTGNFIAAAVKTSRFHGDVSYAEAEAVRWGLQAAVDAGLSSLIIETDSQMVADLINNRKGNKNEIYWVISEIQNKLKDLRNVKCHYTPRSCDAIAHSLASL